MIEITIFDDNGKLETYNYTCIADLANEWHSDSIDMNVPANDAPVAVAYHNGKEIRDVNEFIDVVHALGIK